MTLTCEGYTTAGKFLYFSGTVLQNSIRHIPCSKEHLKVSMNMQLKKGQIEQVGNLSEHARAKLATQFRGIHATRVYKKAQLCKYCQMFGTK